MERGASRSWSDLKGLCLRGIPFGRVLHRDYLCFSAFIFAQNTILNLFRLFPEMLR